MATHGSTEEAEVGSPLGPRREALAVGAAALVLATVSVLPILASITNLGIQDWDQHFFYNAVPRTTLLEYGQIPLWNPYSCGGMVMLAHPLSRLLSPFFPLHLLAGTVVALKIEILLHVAIGLVGTYALGRAYGLGLAGRCLAAIVYMLSTMFVLSLAVGMTSFLTLAYVPWVMLFVRRGLSARRNLVACAATMTLVFFEGGAQPLGITLLWVGMEQAIAVVRRRRLAPLGELVAVLALTLLLGAVKFVPSIAFMVTHPRPMNDYSGFSVASLLHSLVSHEQHVEEYVFADLRRGFRYGFTYGPDENGMYVGYLPLALALVGLVAERRRQWPLLIAFATFLWLAFGNRAQPSLWALLHRAPLYGTMRVAQRFRWLWLLVLALLAGFGLERTTAFARRHGMSARSAGVVAAGAVLVVLTDLVVTGYQAWREAFPIPPWTIERRSEFSQVFSPPLYDARGPRPDLRPERHAAWSALYPALLANEGVIACYETAAVKMFALARDSPQYTGEVFLTDTSGTARYRRWTPNRLEIDVHATGPGLLVVNQNYDPDWHSADGREVVRLRGRLAVPVAADDREVVLAYRPVTFFVGVATSAATLVGLAALARMRRRE